MVYRTDPDGGPDAKKKGDSMPTHQRLLELALKGLEAERERIDDELTQLRRQFGTANGTRPAPQASAERRGGLTAAGRKKLSDMMKKRWAERRKAAAKAAR